ncbi:ParA family protein [Pseudomonas cichorii]|nr:ParA family protein [Pseudomonas cichorii]MBX8557035.1 ParA family protein [Pseudomonas cichorii]MBX8592850.1 ParA family protein [Pseudomonas cichorii]
MQILLVANPKGGVSRTTFCLMTALRARQKNLRVLLVDLDPQGNLSDCFPAACSQNPSASTALSLFSKNRQVLPEELGDGFAILRADARLRSPKRSGRISGDDFVLNLRSIPDEFDVCIIDTARDLGSQQIIFLALYAADYLVSPFTIHPGAIRDMEKLSQLNMLVSKETATPARFLGYIPTRYPADSNRLEQLKDAIGSANHKILPNALPYRASVAAAVASCKPIWDDVSVGDTDHEQAAFEWCSAVDYILNEINTSI